MQIQTGYWDLPSWLRPFETFPAARRKTSSTTPHDRFPRSTPRPVMGSCRLNTTTPCGHSGMGWFGACPCGPAPGGHTPILAVVASVFKVNV
jgi:hypothetical protein